LSSRALISDGPPRSFAHDGASPKRARIASRLPSSPLTIDSTDWVGAMFARRSARSATHGSIVIRNRDMTTWGSRAVLV
jgi:hypothetical protein